MPRAVIYNRCSTEEEAQANALMVQAAESREIVQSKGWLLAEQYIESESGTTAQKRSEYQRLLEDMEKDRFDIIVIKSIDRLMRSAKDWYIFLDKMTRYNKRLYIYIDHKFYTPDDSLLTGIKAILAEDFSRELSKKIKNAHSRRQMKRSGLNITMPMFGWDRVEKDVFVINKEEAASYRLAFALAKEGKGFYTIANMMYEKGVRSKKGTMISGVQWRKMLYSSRAHGTVILHTTEFDFETKKRVKVPEEQWIYMENALPPIVSREYQENVLKTIAERTVHNTFKGYTRDMSKVGRYELSGKIFCGECGGVFYRNACKSGNSQVVRWKCSTALRQGKTGCSNSNISEETLYRKIEENYKEYYQELFGSEDEIIEQVVLVLKKVFRENSGEKERVRWERELHKCGRKKELLLQKLMDEVIGDEEFKVVNKELTEKIEQAREHLGMINGTGPEYNDYEARLHRIREKLVNGLAVKAMTKTVIAEIVRIVVDPAGELEIKSDKLKMSSKPDCKWPYLVVK